MNGAPRNFWTYPAVFGIHITGVFVAVTLAAHMVFGIAMGLMARWLSRRMPLAAH